MNSPSRRVFLRASAAVPLSCSWPRVGSSQDREPPRFDPARDLIAATTDPADWPRFRAELSAWRERTRAALRYDDALYRRPEFAWSARAYACAFVMMCDEAFLDHRTGTFRVESFLDEGEREFGGYDAVVLWHAYPRIGLDERNQFDFYRDQPGGLPGVRSVVDRLHARGVRAFLDYNPWDTGTRREGASDIDTLVELIAAVDADGLFLDTMNEGAPELRRRLDAARPGVVLEGEGALPLERLHDHHASWAQWFNDADVPGVLRNKWFERRHMQHQIKRWDRDHTGELHSAWLNGSGMLVWENVFGSWVGWSARDRALLRAMLPIQRRFHVLFAGEGWTPLVPTRAPGVFAALWEGDGVRLWTLVNRTEQTVSGPLLEIDAAPDAQAFDLIAGRAVAPTEEGPRLTLQGTIPPRGLGAFLTLPAGRDLPDWSEFLASQAALAARYDPDPTPARRATVPVPAPRVRPLVTRPEGMVEINVGADVTLRVRMRERECGFLDSNPPEEGGPVGSYEFRTRSFDRTMQSARFAIDGAPVTNAQYAAFLKDSGHAPRDPANFLKHWEDGRVPTDREDHPVVYVDLDDARSYARWAGKRLPTEEEWQHAAQEPDGRAYPWGDAMEPGRCNGGETGGTTAVDAFPAGRSPLGCLDMCGNVWEWTESERSDGRTRFAIVRGGSYFAAEGSGWYVDGGPSPVDFACKVLLMGPGLDRCATVGFRCAVDLGDGVA